MGIKDAERKRIVTETKLEGWFGVRSEIKGTFFFSRKCENNLQLIPCVDLTLLLMGSVFQRVKPVPLRPPLLTSSPSCPVCPAFAVMDLLS